MANFKPMMAMFDENSYNLAQKKANEKLMQLDKGSSWMHNQFEGEIKVNLKKFHTNMVGYFKDFLLEYYKEQNQLGLSAEKLIDVKEIKIIELHKIQQEYEKIIVDVVIVKNEASVEVKRKDYETWTRTEKQNKRLLVGNELIASIKKLEKSEIAKVYPMLIANATSGFIKFDPFKNKWLVDKGLIFS